MFSFEYCKIVKITCFEERLRTAASTGFYFDPINLKQFGFCTTYFFKIIISEPKHKNNLDNPKKNNYRIYNIYVTF